MRVTLSHFGGIDRNFLVKYSQLRPRVPVLILMHSAKISQPAAPLAFVASGGAANALAGGFLAGADFLPAAGALVVLQNLLAQPNGLGRNFHIFIVRDEFDGLLQAEFAMRDQADGFVGAGRAHVGEFFLACDVYFHVLLAGIFSDDHAFVDVNGWADEKFAAFLNVPQRVRRGNSGTIGDQRACRAQRHFAPVFDPIIEDRVNQRGAASVGKELAAQTDQSARRNAEIHAHAAGAVIAHLDHFAASAAQRFHDDADKIVGNVDDQAFLRFEFSAVFGAHHDFRLANHQFETFAAHGFNQNRELQFATAQHAK